jgi:hypothetical protein
MRTPTAKSQRLRSDVAVKLELMHRTMKRIAVQPVVRPTLSVEESQPARSAG